MLAAREGAVELLGLLVIPLVSFLLGSEIAQVAGFPLETDTRLPPPAAGFVGSAFEVSLAPSGIRSVLAARCRPGVGRPVVGPNPVDMVDPFWQPIVNEKEIDPGAVMAFTRYCYPPASIPVQVARNGSNPNSRSRLSVKENSFGFRPGQRVRGPALALWPL
jgi:hypothetical protein